MLYQMRLSSDNSEIVNYNSPDIHVYSSRGMLSDFAGMRALSHWHDDIELIMALEGRMGYSVNGAEFVLQPRQGLFVNSRQFHYGFSCDGSDCSFVCILINPDALGINDRLRRRYIDTICGDAKYPYIRLYPAIPWQEELMQSLKRMYDCFAAAEDGYELEAAELAHGFWRTLYLNYKSTPNYETAESAKDIDALHSMVTYIQMNYGGKITLDDIAAAGSVCRSACCRIFRQVAHVTPIVYLGRYRVGKSLELLRSTGLSMTEIALQCGFSGSSYFAEIFKREMGCTPKEYKNRGN